jgi:LPS O-antigen subunit length determinant protein (WzzB/FepE family)
LKKNLKIILLSSLIGALFACVFFLSIKEKTEAKNITYIYGFQVGAFKNFENANELKENYPYAKIIKENDYYRVFIGFTVDNKELLQNIYANEEYYMKELIVSDEIKNNITKYDELLLNSNEDTRLLVIKSMMEIMPDEL